MSAAVERVLERLQGVQQRGKGWRAHCPAHEDRDPSLDIDVGADGRALLICRSRNCSASDIASALELEPRDLFERRNGHTRPAKSRGRYTATTYEIRDVHGQLVALHERRDYANGKKQFYWKLPGASRYGLDGRKVDTLPLFGSDKLAGLAPGTTVFLTEGEKATQALWSLGFAAVGTITGADGTPGPDVFQCLAGFNVVTWEDNDEPGRFHMLANAVQLAKLGIAARRLEWAAARSKDDPADFAARGGTAADVQRMVDAAKPCDTSQAGSQPARPDHPYRATTSGLVWDRTIRDIDVATPLTNYTARIIRDVAEDDGSGEIRRKFDMEGRLNGRTVRFTIAAERFSTMQWPTEHLGAGAITYPGTAREHAKVAIQFLSGDVPEEREYTHTGFRKIADMWHFLHAGGAIGPDGTVPSIQTRLPAALQRYELPDPPDADALRRAIWSSLTMLQVAPSKLMTPIYAGIWRAPLGLVDFAQFIVGPTGVGKSELAALVNQHFGAGLDARHLPASWASTGNANEALAFAAKDVVLTADDFAPTGSAADVQRYHKEGDRLIRGAGNLHGRLRMQADATLRAAKWPRGSIYATGEDLPRQQSIRARVLAGEVEPGSVDWDVLSQCQQDAADGLYAAAMAGYVRWLAARYDAVQATLRRDVIELRQAAVQSATHRRTPEIVANLALGLRYFFTFACEVGALTEDGAAQAWTESWTALGAAAAAQSAHQAASEPTRRFLELVSAAIAGGLAHVANEQGGAPPLSEAWGWRVRDNTRPDGSGSYSEVPQGRLIGWIAGDDLFLQPDMALAVAQEIGNKTGDPLTIQPKTLHKRLAERGLLRSTDEARNRLTVRRSLSGKRQTVLHFRLETFMPPEPAQPAQPAQPATGAAVPIWRPVAHDPSAWAGSGSENRPRPDEKPTQGGKAA